MKTLKDSEVIDEMAKKSTVGKFIDEIEEWLGCDHWYARKLFMRAMEKEEVRCALWEQLHLLETDDVIKHAESLRKTLTEKYEKN